MSSVLRSLLLACAVLSAGAFCATTSATAPAEQDPSAQPPEEVSDNEKPADRVDDTPQEPPPAEASGKGPDAPTPKDALKLLAVAMHEGDASQIRGLLYVANEPEGRMADAMAAMAGALARLHAAAVKEFGEQGASALTGQAAGSPQKELERIESADVSVADGGESATVVFKPDPAAPPETEEGPAPPVVMRRIDGRWRVPISELSKGVAAADLEQRLADLAVQNRVIARLTKEIAAGRYKNADEAADAWNAKITEALSPRPRKPPADDSKGGADAPGKGCE